MNYLTSKHIGKRKNQEDYFLVSEPLFIVCDGVGGANKGEVASQFVAKKFKESTVDRGRKPIDERVINDAIDHILKQMSSRLQDAPEEEGMGTTFTMAFKHTRGLSLAHIGDSRIYYLKPRRSLYWQTKDHSMVQSLIEGGHITEEQAETHPMKNRITRALQSKIDYDCVKADVTEISDIEQGDLMLLCSDGVTEAFKNKELLEVLVNESSTLNDKYESIKNKCEELSKDNNTFILVEFEEEDEVVGHSNSENVVFNTIEKEEYLSDDTISIKVLYYILFFLVIIFLFLTFINLYGS